MESSTGLDSATLNRLHTTLSSQQVSREFHAFTRLCPPSAAQRLLALTPEELSRLSEQCHVAINAWLCCDRTYEVERDAPSLTTRDSTLPGKTKTRDGACVITGMHPKFCEAAHIIPYSIGKSQARARTDLWKVLQMFWGDQRVTELQKLIFGNPDLPRQDLKTEVSRLYNVVTLSRDSHFFWGEGLFTLEPYPHNDPGNLYTQRAVFNWIYPNGCSMASPGVYVPINLTDPPPPLSAQLLSGNTYTGLTDGRTHPPRPIQDGHIVTFHTDDPVARPLPNRELLWLQCSLIRVLRMAGRAGWDTREMNESEKDVDSLYTDDMLSGEQSWGSAVNIRSEFTSSEPKSGTTPREPNADDPIQAHRSAPPSKIKSALQPIQSHFRRLIHRAKSWTRSWKLHDVAKA